MLWAAKVDMSLAFFVRIRSLFRPSSSNCKIFISNFPGCYFERLRDAWREGSCASSEVSCSVLICFVPFCRNSMFTGRYRLGLSSKDSTALPLPQRDITWQLTPTRYSYVRRYLTNQILFPGSFFLSRRKPRPETAWIECFKFATGSKSWHPTGSRWVPRNERRLPWPRLPEGAKRNRQQSPNLRRQKLQVRIATYFTILY